ncbi:hypothetical protein Y032_0014g2223 [Ancylostoma ceylanicum]|uniref:EF-hand domain-containing protein n=2 Tax=Ancylostoma ceylanicum TaxID=53326 RepID=A0A016V916_9BILA|nr:hypothetical protein Y032_0014g2223 [Ancylostoma ceylanicum]
MVVHSSMGELEAKFPDVDPFLLRKWERIFSMFFDRNASHQVDWGDFYLVVRKVKDIYGAESVQTEYARKTLAALWEGLCKLADADEDQLISIDEWINLLRKAQEKKEQKWFDEYERFMFKLFDVSCDGVMDVEEYIDGMNVYGMKRAECKEAFQKFAVDEKGAPVAKLSKELWSRYFHELFYSTDKNALGNHLFGICDI